MNNAQHVDRLLPLDQLKSACPIVADKSDRTLARWEKEGRFPRRKRISRSTIAWSERELAEWSLDPEGWAARHSSVVTDNAA